MDDWRSHTRERVPGNGSEYGVAGPAATDGEIASGASTRHTAIEANALGPEDHRIPIDRPPGQLHRPFGSGHGDQQIRLHDGGEASQVTSIAAQPGGLPTSRLASRQAPRSAAPL